MIGIWFKEDIERILAEHRIPRPALEQGAVGGIFTQTTIIQCITLWAYTCQCKHLNNSSLPQGQAVRHYDCRAGRLLQCMAANGWLRGVMFR